MLKSSRSVHRQQCYCLSRHVLAVPSFSTHAIIIAWIKLSDFRLLPSMNRRLLIKRSDVWSKSEGVIKLTKALSFKRSLRSSQDFCQQSRLQRHSLSFFCWHATLAMVWALKPKVFPQKILLLKRCQMESAVRETTVGKININDISAWMRLTTERALLSIVCVIRFNSRRNFKASPNYCHARLTEGTKQEL